LIKPVCAAVFGDTHINKKMAVLAPGFAVDNGDEFSRARSWLWARFLEYRDEWKRQSRGCKRVLLLGGDIGEFDSKDRSNQLVSSDKVEIKDMTLKTLDPFTSIADEIHVIGGTSAHGGKGAELERWLADDLKAKFSWTFLANIGGVLVEMEHHASSGKWLWTNGNAAVRIAADTVMNYASNGDPIPRYVFRDHVHHYEDSFENVKTCRAVILPCWTFHDENDHRIGLGTRLPDIGGAILGCYSGRSNLEIWRRKPRRETPLTI
jgi:hypothetical protein